MTLDDVTFDDVTFDALVEHKQLIVCCGSGGVGKTTLAAAIALHGARLGRRACVVTIDPAKRLADALGLDALTNTPSEIIGPWSGELWALMLDTKGTFDELITRYAAAPAQAEAILNNGLYRNISGALSGTQEYMAVEKLYELSTEGAGGTDFDLIVLDTPPTRNALDFLRAPGRLTSLLDNRIFRLLIMPTRAYLKVVSGATQSFLRTISRVVGGEVVSDAIKFFSAFKGMEQGFRDRAEAVSSLLSDDRTGFVVATSPRPDAVEEAGFFADHLIEAGLGVDALIVNRMHPRFGTASPVDPSSPLANLRANLADFERVAQSEESQFAGLATRVERVASSVIVRVPFLPDDVHDLTGLEIVESYLFAS